MLTATKLKLKSRNLSRQQNNKVIDKSVKKLHIFYHKNFLVENNLVIKKT